MSTGTRGRVAPAGLVRPEIRELAAYTLEQAPCRFKLDQNEVPWDFPRTLKEEVARRLGERDWARYPDFHADAVRRAVGALNEHPWEGVLLGNGSNELLGVALEALVRPGTEVLGAHPTFGLYRMLVVRSGGIPRFLAPRDDLALPFEALAREVERHPERPVILCTPNNPTGAALTAREVAALLERLEAPLLLDNAYGEFCRHDYRKLLGRHPHLLLFRTFSKAWSLAGLRLGVLLAHPELVGELIKVKLPYNLGHAGAVAAAVALEHAPRLACRVRVLVGRRERLAGLLRRHGFTVPPSEANFLLARSPRGVEIDRVRRGLAARGILVRDVSHYPGLAGAMRVSVGDGAAERALDSALTEILTEESR